MGLAAIVWIIGQIPPGTAPGAPRRNAVVLLVYLLVLVLGASYLLQLF